MDIAKLVRAAWRSPGAHLALALLLTPYLYLYLAEYSRLLSRLPPGDDFPIHVYMALLARENPVLLVLSPGQYPGIPHLLGLLSGDPLVLGRIFGVYTALLVPVGIALYGLYFASMGADRRVALLASSLLVLGSVRTLAGLVDGQLADKTVLLVLVPLGLYLYARGRELPALAVLALSLFVNYLGFAYASLLALLMAAFGSRRAKLALLAAAPLVAALAFHKLGVVVSLASQWQKWEGAPPFVISATWLPAYAFYGPSGYVLPVVAAYMYIKARRARPLLLAALAIFAIALASPTYGERLMRVAALLLPAAVVAAGFELRRWALPALALYLAGPAAVGWLWAAGLLGSGLFAYVDRVLPGQLEAYHVFLSSLPEKATVGVRWSLDMWFLPLAQAYRPDLQVLVWDCRWGAADFYVFTPPDPRQWYMDCVRNATAPPGRLITVVNGVGLYEGQSIVETPPS
ncbi:hypothetical protein [Pyrobaculum sp.]|uniref:hypothetical protein n=1 Tax=Pyrobaculum sp. TaxID=2004705 RepID=UPI0031656224